MCTSEAQRKTIENHYLRRHAVMTAWAAFPATTDNDLRLHKRVTENKPLKLQHTLSRNFCGRSGLLFKCPDYIEETFV